MHARRIFQGLPIMSLNTKTTLLLRDLWLHHEKLWAETKYCPVLKIIACPLWSSISRKAQLQCIILLHLRIGTSKRLLSEGSKDSRMNPGVGAYDISAQSHIRAAFLTSKHSEINHENIPGPNQYQPNFDVVLSKTPKFT